MSPRAAVEAARSLLFVPGHRPDRFDRAAASGADLVVVDLEDAVAPERKAEARDSVRQWLRNGHQAVVRINATGTQWHDDDVAMAAGCAAAVMLPKAEAAADLAALAGRLPEDTPLIPLVESALGVARAVELCGVPAVVRPAFGSVDLAAQLGVDHQSHDALRYARSALVLAAAAAGCAAPIDGVSTAVGDERPLRADAAHAIELGFTGKLGIHPQQVGVINEAFLPTESELAWARQILSLAGDGAVTVRDGQMIDRPVWLRAQAVLARAAEGQG